MHLQSQTIKSCLYTLCILLLIHPLGATQQNELETPVRINVAEGITDPFWDPEISTFDVWTVQPGRSHGLKVFQNWAAIDFSWRQSPESGPALRMSRAYPLDCSDYNTLLLRLAAPKDTPVRIIAETDQGTREIKINAPVAGLFEYALPLAGAQRVDTLTLEVFATGAGTVAGWIEWIGFQHTKLLQHYERRWDHSNLRWDRHIIPKDKLLDYKPHYGIFLSEEKLQTLREDHEKAFAETGTSSYSALAEAAPAMDFQAAINEFTKSGGKDRGRTRNVTETTMPGGTNLAMAGLILKDRGLLEAAARYALSLAACEHWDKNFRAHFPGGPADDRAFRRSYTCEDIAEILDLAGEVFSPGGRSYLMRRLAEEGIGPINYVTWRHEYIHETNQLAYFNKGRVYAALVLEREYPRVKPYTDLALQDTLDNIEIAILPDGGYAEGATYFAALARRNYYILQHYALARDLDLATLVPPALRNTANFAEAIASTTEKDVIAIGDSGDYINYPTLEAMVELMPDSAWLTMLNKRRRIDGLEPIPGNPPQARPFIALPDLGMVSSTREHAGHLLKIIVPGNPPHADHAHEDKGSFVIEYGGQTYAMDPGSTEYSDPIHHLYKHAQRHNMLTPVGLDERPAPPVKLRHHVQAQGEGDERTFHATIEATPGWTRYYKSWVRQWDSDSPEQLRITDTYELKRGTGVSFHWQTPLPCTLQGQSARIVGDHATFVLTAQEDCTLALESLPMADSKSQNHITITRESQRGKLIVDLHIETSP